MSVRLSELILFHVLGELNMLEECVVVKHQKIIYLIK